MIAPNSKFNSCWNLESDVSRQRSAQSRSEYPDLIVHSAWSGCGNRCVVVFQKTIWVGLGPRIANAMEIAMVWRVLEGEVQWGCQMGRGAGWLGGKFNVIFIPSKDVESLKKSWITSKAIPKSRQSVNRFYSVCVFLGGTGVNQNRIRVFVWRLFLFSPTVNGNWFAIWSKSISLQHWFCRHGLHTVSEVLQTMFFCLISMMIAFEVLLLWLAVCARRGC